MKNTVWRMWMVFGPRDNPAPYWGCAFTRKALKEQILRMAPDGRTNPSTHYLKQVRVTIKE